VLAPDLYYSSVLAIDLDALERDGVRALLLDLDNTLLPRDTNVVPDETRRWAQRVHAAGFEVCLVSNNWHERVKAVADELGFGLVDKALKPFPFAFRRALRECGTSAEHAAVVGDQIFTDILGGNLLHMRTILVQPLSRTDLPHTLLLRHLESLVLKGREPLG
jgi:uncharacterized protein